MKLLVGLGNMGEKHVDNRHNIGWKILSHWLLARGERFSEKAEFRGLVAKTNLGSDSAVCLLPLTYMNRSGEAVERVMNFYKIAIEDVVVLHDELDIPANSFRIKRGGGHGGHNGLRSIHPLGDAYLRLRLGIGRPPIAEMEVADFVLGNFTLAERSAWESVYGDVAQALELCAKGLEAEAMHRFHTKPKVST
jgi:PTH1 family peptidyl-tRNA hydrolase